MSFLSLLASLLGINFALFGTGCGRSGCTIASSEFTTSGQEVGIGFSTLGGASIAQSFYVTNSTNLKNIQIQLQKVGTFTTNSGYLISVAVYSNVAGQPGSQLSTVPTLSLDNIATTATNYTFTPTQLAVTTGTYWIVVYGNYPVSATNYVKATAHEGSTNDYTLGQAMYTDGSSNWLTTQWGAFRDLYFIVGCSS